MDSLANPAAAAATTTSFNRHHLNRTSSATISTHTTLINPQPPPHNNTIAHKSRHTSFALTNPTTSPLLLSKSKLEPLNPRRRSSSNLSSSSSSVHRRAATGYAAALLEAAQFNGALAVAALEKDVRRLSKVLERKDVKGLMEDGSVGKKEKGQLLKAVVDVGRFREELKAVVNLLVDKGSLGVVWEALDEFRRIHGQLKFAS